MILRVFRVDPPRDGEVVGGEQQRVVVAGRENVAVLFKKFLVNLKLFLEVCHVGTQSEILVLVLVLVIWRVKLVPGRLPGAPRVSHPRHFWARKCKSSTQARIEIVTLVNPESGNESFFRRGKPSNCSRRGL